MDKFICHLLLVGGCLFFIRKVAEWFKNEHIRNETKFEPLIQPTTKSIKLFIRESYLFENNRKKGD